MKSSDQLKILAGFSTSVISHGSLCCPLSQWRWPHEFCRCHPFTFNQGVLKTVPTYDSTLIFWKTIPQEFDGFSWNDVFIIIHHHHHHFPVQSPSLSCLCFIQVKIQEFADLLWTSGVPTCEIRCVALCFGVTEKTTPIGIFFPIPIHCIS